MAAKNIVSSAKHVCARATRTSVENSSNIVVLVFRSQKVKQFDDTGSSESVTRFSSKVLTQHPECLLVNGQSFLETASEVY